MQRGAVERWQPTGLNSSIPILPQFLKTAGYKNYLGIKTVKLLLCIISFPKHSFLNPNFLDFLSNINEIDKSLRIIT